MNLSHLGIKSPQIEIESGQPHLRPDKLIWEYVLSPRFNPGVCTWVEEWKKHNLLSLTLSGPSLFSKLEITGFSLYFFPNLFLMPKPALWKSNVESLLSAFFFISFGATSGSTQELLLVVNRGQYKNQTPVSLCSAKKPTHCIIAPDLICIFICDSFSKTMKVEKTIYQQ